MYMHYNLHEKVYVFFSNSSKSVIKLSPGFFEGWGLSHCSTGNLKKKEVNLIRQQ